MLCFCFFSAFAPIFLILNCAVMFFLGEDVKLFLHPAEGRRYSCYMSLSD